MVIFVIPAIPIMGYIFSVLHWKCPVVWVSNVVALNSITNMDRGNVSTNQVSKDMAEENWHQKVLLRLSCMYWIL